MAENTQIAALTKQPKTFTLPPPPELGGIIKQIGGVPGVPYTPPTDYAEERKKFKTSTDVSTREAELLQRQDQLDKEIGAVKQAVDQYRAEAGASIATQKREEAEQIESNLDAIRKKFPYEAFHPTKDNIQDLATLFSLISVIGVAMGGSGKQSAMMSLNAMSGMMKGWQQGRADLWKKEKEEFYNLWNSIKNDFDVEFWNFYWLKLFLNSFKFLISDEIFIKNGLPFWFIKNGKKNFKPNTFLKILNNLYLEIIFFRENNIDYANFYPIEKIYFFVGFTFFSFLFQYDPLGKKDQLIKIIS